MLKSFVNLIHPTCCPACNEALLNPDDFICTHCRYHLPKTDFHKHEENPVHDKFKGRIIVNAATSFLYFFKGGITQELIAKLKYKGRKDVGIFLGEMYGYDLLESELFNTVDMIIPVPLHKDKFKKRGYNQSEQFAEGLSNTMKIPTDYVSLIKKTASATQTTKRRYERWKNVEDAYFLNDLNVFKGKHVLLVDDVITTGATLEATATVLLAVANIKISIATIACS